MMENYKMVEDFAKEIRGVEPRLSTDVNGNYITGTFRGKRGNEYKYSFTEKKLIYDNGGYAKGVISKILKSEA